MILAPNRDSQIEVGVRIDYIGEMVGESLESTQHSQQQKPDRQTVPAGLSYEHHDLLHALEERLAPRLTPGQR